MKEKSIVGDLINFRGLVYSPTNENGVIFLFGKVVEDLNMYIEEIKPGFPDCVGRRFTGKGWERIYIEFEYESRSFKGHGHNPDGCDMIICWKHNWQDCTLEVIELKEVIKTLKNEPIRPPDKIGPDKITIEEHLKKFPDKIGSLFWKLDAKISKISDEIWSKVTGKPGVTYYCPERVFIYVRLQVKGIKLTIFTRGEELEGLQSIEYTKGVTKWGRMHIRDEKQLGKAISIIERSHRLIKDAIKNNEATGWSAALEEEDSEGDTAKTDDTS